MRKGILLLTAAGLVLGLVGMSAAHLPEGEIFFAVQFPDEAVPTIDGNLADWEIVPTNPYTMLNVKLYDSAQFQGVERGEIDATDMNIRHRFGWNDTFNKLYVATQVFDNIHNTDRADPGKFFHDDAWELEVNADATAKELHNQDFANNISYKFAVPPIESTSFFLRPMAGLTWLVPGSEYITFGWSFDGEQLGESTYYYEIAITPIESMPLDEATSLDGMVELDLEEAEIVHISLNVGDVDAGDDYFGFWGTSPGGCCSGDNDFVLTEMDQALLDNLGSTAVETDTWGRIKSQFK